MTHLERTQKQIQEWLDDLIPTEITLNEETQSKLDPEMIKACHELHAFISCLYNDMYHNPAEYGILHEDKETRERAASRIHQAIWERIPDMNFKNVNLEPLKALQRCGLYIEETDNEIKITNTKYPNMLLPLTKLRQAAKKNYAGSHVYNRCDFRLIANPKYQPTLDDITRNRTSPEMHTLLFQIDAYARAKNFRTECRVKECIYYKFKGKRLFNIRVRRDEVHVEIGIGKLEHINEMEAVYPAEVRDFIRRNMNYCRNCFAHHNGGVEIVFFGKKVRICGGGPFLFIKNPKPENFGLITKAIDLGCDVRK